MKFFYYRTTFYENHVLKQVFQIWKFVNFISDRSLAAVMLEIPA